ncbi:MAG TPA: response regulator [Vicinamibacteria bacterium]|nr:response regulator [Vicinamibacteria bacterium]
MSERYILIIDDDEAFGRRLRAIVEPGGYQLVPVRTEGEVLDQLARLSPEAVFIAVDLPGKEGFAWFSKVKKLRRMVPVFLTTTTVPRAELKLHEKLKVHADAYWDKRAVDDNEISTALANKIGLAVNERLETLAPVPQTPFPQGTATEPWLAELLDAETASILEEIDEYGSLDAVSTGPETSGARPSAQRVAELEDTNRQLRLELDQARRDARSSPFSSDFSRLRESASQKDRKIRSLEGTLLRREAQMTVVKSKLTDLARRLLDSQRSGEAASRQRAELEESLDAIRTRLKRLEATHREQKQRDEQALFGLKEQLAAERAASAAARAETETELTRLRETHDEALKAADSQYRARETELNAQHLASKLRQVDELESKYAARLREAQAAVQRAIETARDERKKEVESLNARYRAASEKSAADAREALEQATAQCATLLDRANEQRLQELKRADEKRLADLTQAQTRHQSELDGLSRAHASAKQQLEQQLHSARQASEKSTAELNAKLQELEGRLTEERARHDETRERYEREAAALQVDHSKHREQAEQDQFSALAGLSKKFREDRARLLEAERLRFEERAARLKHELDERVETLVARHQEQMSLLQAAHENEARLMVNDQEQLTREAVDKTRADLQKDLDAAARQHADEIAALRKEHESETSSLRAAHIEALRRRDRESQDVLIQALDKAREESTQRIAEAHREANEALTALRQQHEKQIAALENAHRQASSKRDRGAREALRDAEQRREDAMQEASRLRAEIDQVQTKHRSALSESDDQRQTALRALQEESERKLTRMEEEKNFLGVSIEKLKQQSQKELARAIGAVAHEKKLHQATRDRYERRIAELQLNHDENAKQIERDWMHRLEELETSLVTRKEHASSKSEAEWKARLDRERIQNEESVKALTNDFAIELATLRRQVERSKALEESYKASNHDVTNLRNKLTTAGEQLTEARMSLAEREHELEVHRKKLADTTGTIDSLKAVIDDFSRSVEGIDRERKESDGTIDSLRAVIDDFYRSVKASGPTN